LYAEPTTSFYPSKKQDSSESDTTESETSVVYYRPQKKSKSKVANISSQTSFAKEKAIEQESSSPEECLSPNESESFHDMTPLEVRKKNIPSYKIYKKHRV
jgi:hypothetical protein